MERRYRNRDTATNVTDMLADIRHLCDEFDIDFFAQYDSAYDHYLAEVNEARYGIKLGVQE